MTVTNESNGVQGHARKSSMPHHESSSPAIKDNTQHTDRGIAESSNHANKFFEDYGVWKEAPVLTGSTRFEPLPDVKNIMITGGAGFM